MSARMTAVALIGSTVTEDSKITDLLARFWQEYGCQYCLSHYHCAHRNPAKDLAEIIAWRSHRQAEELADETTDAQRLAWRPRRAKAKELNKLAANMRSKYGIGAGSGGWNAKKRPRAARKIDARAVSLPVARLERSERYQDTPDSPTGTGGGK